MAAPIKITKETETVSKNLAQIFNENPDLTYKEVADKAGISDALLGAIIHKQRNISPEALVKLASALHVSTDYLLGLFVPESLDDLAKLHEQKRYLEQRVSASLYDAAKLKTSTERAAAMQMVAELDEQIALITTSIERASSGPIRIPERGGNAVYRPAGFVDTTECVVIKNGSDNVPADSVVFLGSTNNPTRVYLVNNTGKFHLTKTPAPDCDVVGEATYVLLPANACISA